MKKKWKTGLGLVSLTLMIGAAGVTTLAADGLEVTQKNFYELESMYSFGNAYLFAKVENTSSNVLALGTGKFVGFNQNDDIILTNEYIGLGISGFQLKPGEYTYVREYFFDSELSKDDVADYRFSMETSKWGWGDTKTEKISCEAEYSIEGSNFEKNYIDMAITNEKEEAVFGVYVSAAILDEAGNILFVEEDALDTVGIGPQSTIIVRLPLENEILEYFEKKQIEPFDVDAVAYLCEF